MLIYVIKSSTMKSINPLAMRHQPFCDLSLIPLLNLCGYHHKTEIIVAKNSSRCCHLSLHRVITKIFLYRHFNFSLQYRYENPSRKLSPIYPLMSYPFAPCLFNLTFQYVYASPYRHCVYVGKWF